MGKAIPADMEKRTRKEGANVFVKGTHVLQALGAALLILNLLVIYAIAFSPKGLLGYREQCRQVTELDAKVRRLTEENHRLFRRIQGFKNDPRAQERLVREKLGWVREDELVIEFVPTGNNSPGRK